MSADERMCQKPIFSAIASICSLKQSTICVFNGPFGHSPALKVPFCCSVLCVIFRYSRNAAVHYCHGYSKSLIYQILKMLISTFLYNIQHDELAKKKDTML